MPRRESTPPTAPTGRDGDDARRARKARGDWPTPAELVDRVVDHTLAPIAAGRRVAVLDPACGDGRFLAAAAARIEAAGGVPVLTGVDVEAAALDLATVALAGRDVRLWHADALALDWGAERFDVVVGNPPFLSQLSSVTTRGGASRHGGGPYADAAAEFLALSIRLTEPAGGRVGMVLPQSILSSRDAGPVRADVARRAAMTWSWWSTARVFDAQVHVCALAFELGARPARIDRGAIGADTWAHVVTDALGVPSLPALERAGTLGDRADVRANFRNEYYGLVPAVGDHETGPPYVTSGVVDPGRCRWGERPVRFARRVHARPRVDLARLDAQMRRWADSRLVPKVLVANQTRAIEAVADRDGAWLPGVPLISVMPRDRVPVDEPAAVLTSPVATAWAWHRVAGTGLSANALRLGPRVLAALPWPAGPLDAAVTRLAAGDVVGCGVEVQRAYGLDPHDDGLVGWWAALLPEITASVRRQDSGPITDRLGASPGSTS